MIFIAFVLYLFRKSGTVPCTAPLHTPLFKNHTATSSAHYSTNAAYNPNSKHFTVADAVPSILSAASYLDVTKRPSRKNKSLHQTWGLWISTHVINALIELDIKVAGQRKDPVLEAKLPLPLAKGSDSECFKTSPDPIDKTIVLTAQ